VGFVALRVDPRERGRDRGEARPRSVIRDHVLDGARSRNAAAPRSCAAAIPSTRPRSSHGSAQSPRCTCM